MFDKILGKLGLDGEDYYDDVDDEEIYDDGDDYYDEPKKSSRSSIFSGRSNDSDYSDTEERKPSRPLSRKEKVVPMQQRSSLRGLEVCVIRPQSIEDAREITDTLKDGKAVVLNLEGVRVEVAQRIIDFSAGSSYSMEGNLQKITGGIFIITPPNVSVSGDLSELVNSEISFASSLGDKVTSQNLDF